MFIEVRCCISLFKVPNSHQRKMKTPYIKRRRNRGLEAACLPVSYAENRWSETCSLSASCRSRQVNCVEISRVFSCVTGIWISILEIPPRKQLVTPLWPLDSSTHPGLIYLCNRVACHLMLSSHYRYWGGWSWMT